MHIKILKIMSALFVAAMVTLTGCAGQPTTSQTSDIYKEVNKEDAAFNQNSENENDYSSSGGQGQIDKIDKTGEKNSTKPKDIEVTIALTPTITIENVEENYECYTIKAPTNEILYIPVVGKFEQSHKTENYTPSNNETEIGFFWDDNDGIVLTVATLQKTQDQTFEYFFNYLNGMANRLSQDPTVTQVNLSELSQLNYKNVPVYYYNLTYSIRGNDGIVKDYAKSICFLEREKYFVYCILDNSTNVPLAIESIIEQIYPIIIEYNNITVISNESEQVIEESSSEQTSEPDVSGSETSSDQSSNGETNKDETLNQEEPEVVAPIVAPAK